ncbi:TnsA endonuclease N-terminal domain-containing protein [Bradyrhizobium sp. GCM10028915]|uniref:TnsA endonuclease N-terminal domain-containing protein n=1 Tax=Bradyrhizobium sp. GCM10028915 TaxID=3273385 RepID=UPI00361EB7D1
MSLDGEGEKLSTRYPGGRTASHRAAKPARRRPGRGAKVSRWKQKTHRLIKGAEARKIRTGRHDHYVGDVPMTRLNGKLVSGDSLLEIDALFLLDYDGGFEDVVAQPFTIEIEVRGRLRRWTPDFLIVRKDSQDELVEVKILSWLYHSDPTKAALARARLDALRSACSRRGFSFMLLTEDEIRVEPRLYNAHIAHRHNGPLVSPSSVVIGLSALAAAPATLTIKEFAHLIAPLHPIFGLGLAVRLERLGHIRIDRRTRYSLDSTITKVTEPHGARE